MQLETFGYVEMSLKHGQNLVKEKVYWYTRTTSRHSRFSPFETHSRYPRNIHYKGYRSKGTPTSSPLERRCFRSLPKTV